MLVTALSYIDFMKKRFILSKKMKITLIVIGVLVIIRLMLPYIVLHYANKSLASMPDYYGHIEDIDISLYRGAYQVQGMYLNKKDEKNGKQTDFFKVKNIDLSVHWRALLHGKLVGELIFNSPELVFTNNKTDLANVKKDTNDFRKMLKDFMPLKVNRFEVNNGKISYRDPEASPKVDVSLTNVYALAQNLTNANNEKVVLPATLTARANAYQGTATLNMKLNPLAQKTTFDLNAEVKNINLVMLNDFLKAYANVDVNKGTLGLYTEFASKNGKYTGYVKPVIKDLDVLGPEDKKDNLFHKLWEGLVGAVGVVLKNHKEDQVATRIPMEGDFAGSHTDILETVFELLRNAFIQALIPSIDNKINLGSLEEKKPEEKKGFFKRLFGGKDKKEEKKKDK
jgi:uncharacterized protein YhdP